MTQTARPDFTARIEQSRALVYDLRVTLNAERRYFIIRVERSRHAAFLRAVERDQGFIFEDFGDILHRGWDEPDEDLKADLRQRFGMYAD